jgi:hypothetical protein
MFGEKQLLLGMVSSLKRARLCPFTGNFSNKVFFFVMSFFKIGSVELWPRVGLEL